MPTQYVFGYTRATFSLPPGSLRTNPTSCEDALDKGDPLSLPLPGREGTCEGSLDNTTDRNLLSLHVDSETLDLPVQVAPLHPDEVSGLGYVVSALRELTFYEDPLKLGPGILEFLHVEDLVHL